MKTNQVNFREIRERFTHIDATFESFSVSPNLDACRYTVRFYPWWEHPLYLEARNKNAPWGFEGASSDGALPVTVIGEDLYAFHLTRQDQVIDWDFLEEHPLLWPYEDAAEILCNSNFDRIQLIEAILRRQIDYLTEEVLYGYLSPRALYRAPFSLGSFPTSLFEMIREELQRMGVALCIPREPEVREHPVLFLAGDEDYIIARDFSLDVPEFEHKTEWFRP